METETQTATETTAAPAAPAAPAAAASKGSAQKEAVYQFAVAALGEAKPAEGQPLKSLVTKEIRKTIRAKLFAGAREGSIKLKRPMDDSKLKKYCSSLINNWLKKDPRFN